MSEGTYVEPLVRAARPTGQPPRCAVCGVVCDPSYAGPVRCKAHKPQGRGDKHLPPELRAAGRPATTTDLESRRRRCHLCGEWKDADEFYGRTRDRLLGRQHRCKACQRQAETGSLRERLKARHADTWPNRPPVAAMPRAE